jgi:hypothetical protein
MVITDAWLRRHRAVIYRDAGAWQRAAEAAMGDLSLQRDWWREA